MKQIDSGRSAFDAFSNPQLEAEVTKWGRELRLAQEAKNRELVRTITPQYEAARNALVEAENAAYVRHKQSSRSKTAEKEHAAMLRAPQIKR